MSFDDDSFHSEVRRVVERNRNNLINFRFNYRDKIASFLRLHFYDVNEIKKRNWIDWTLIHILMSFFWIFLFYRRLTLIRVLVHYFDWNFNFLLLCFFKIFWNLRSRVFVFDFQNVSFLLLVNVELPRFFHRFQ